MWTALGTVGTCAGLAVTWWQVRLQASERRRAETGTSEVFGLTVTVPTGAQPQVVRGRDALLGELRGWARKPPGAAVVLAGLGGVGKSTVAAALAEWRHRGRRHRQVWWVSAADRSALTGGMVTVARRLGAGRPDLDAIASGAADGPDRLWSLLSHAPAGWLLVLDNADDPEVLAAAPGDDTADGTGWVRPSRRGLVVVTSRVTDPPVWGRHAVLRVVEPLGEQDAACVLRDLAGAAGGQQEARSLARRLGGLPLALRLAGAYLGTNPGRLRTFAAYRRALDSGGPQLLDDLDPRANPRSMVTRTWEISLDELAESGLPRARELLRILSCYASATPVPLDLIDDGDLEPALRGLRRVGLIELRPPDDPAAVVVHPVVADSNRFHLTGEAAAHAAVDMVTAHLAEAALDRPTDWPRYRALAPHLRCLLDNTARLVDRAHLTALIESTLDTVRALHKSGALEDSEILCRAALEPAGGLGPDDPVAVRVGRELAGAVVARGRLREAESMVREVVAQSRRVLGNDHPDTLSAAHMHAWTVAAIGRPAAAEIMFRAVFRAQRRVLGADHPETLASQHELAWIAAGQGRWAEAEERYRHVLAERRRILGDDHPDTLLTEHELAWVVANQGRFEEARAAFQQVLRLRDRVLGSDHPRTLTTLHELAWVSAMQGDPDPGSYHRLWQLRRRVIGEEHPDTLTARHELAWVTALLGHLDAAEAIYREVHAVRVRVLGAEHPDSLATRAALDGLRRGEIVDARHLA